MGVDLGSIVEKKEISLESLAGRTIGIDSFNILYQFLSSIRGADGSPLMDSKGRTTSHLTGLLYRTANIIEKDIRPVFVFDGEPSKLKAKTREERQRIRTDAEKKFEDAKKEGRTEDMRKYAQQALRLTGEMIGEAKSLVRLMGLPVIDAPGEGEAQVSAMCASGTVFACASQDFDALLFGSPRLVRNMATTGKRKVPGKEIYIDVNPEMIELGPGLKALGLDREKLVWIAMLIGTDFNEKIPGIGPKKALDLVKKHSSFEDILKEAKAEPEFDYREISELFLHPQATEKYSIEFGMPDSEGIKRLLCDEHSFSRERVEKAIERLKIKMEQKGKQSKLDAWG
ncbi:MAG: flap endonuclease-1 [Candidatus Diapherotrites archaeon]|nr:flap endonuclease-1 [Candidatus Diapherotrites archaeon]